MCQYFWRWTSIVLVYRLSPPQSRERENDSQFHISSATLICLIVFALPITDTFSRILSSIVKGVRHKMCVIICDRFSKRSVGLNLFGNEKRITNTYEARAPRPGVQTIRLMSLCICNVILKTQEE